MGKGKVKERRHSSKTMLTHKKIRGNLVGCDASNSKYYLTLAPVNSL